MKALFIGGTGIISSACVDLALERGHAVSVLNRGNRAIPDGCEPIIADANDLAGLSAALRDRSWDVVVDFVSFTTEDVEKRIAAFAEKTKQYVFISSASAYQRPSRHYLVTEETPLENPFWKYSRDKIACEERLRREHERNAFPVTVVRPSLTYGDRQIPLAMNCWGHPYTGIARMKAGKPMIIPGDGSSLWTLTHNTDFAKGLVGLFGNEESIGEAFHITSDEVLSWDQIYQATAEAAGVASPSFVHIASDFIIACMPDKLGSLTGDKMSSLVMDNSKIKRFVPGFEATTPYAEGIRKTVEWFEADPSRQSIDTEIDATYDRLVALYQQGLDAAQADFASAGD